MCIIRPISSTAPSTNRRQFTSDHGRDRSSRACFGLWASTTCSHCWDCPSHNKLKHNKLLHWSDALKLVNRVYFVIHKDDFRPAVFLEISVSIDLYYIIWLVFVILNRACIVNAININHQSCIGNYLLWTRIF